MLINILPHFALIIGIAETSYFDFPQEKLVSTPSLPSKKEVYWWGSRDKCAY